MLNPELIERTQKFLFATEEEMAAGGLTTAQRGRLLRLRAMYSYWLNTPSLAEKAIVTELKKRYHVATSIAYEDVRLIKVCLGNLNQNTTDYYRYLFLARTEEAFQMARDKNDPRAFAAVLATLGKYTRLDHDETEAPDFETIAVQPFEISNNPEVSGFKRIENVEEIARKLYLKMSKDAAKAVEFEEVEEVKPLENPLAHEKLH